ncbi:hypothetical protein J6590_022299 [Homalodisca vitripennis]|nr:hypothetical protein J6590_022299 [Homalodisca vitripennis]
MVRLLRYLQTTAPAVCGARVGATWRLLRRRRLGLPTLHRAGRRKRAQAHVFHPRPSYHALITRPRCAPASARSSRLIYLLPGATGCEADRVSNILTPCSGSVGHTTRIRTVRRFKRHEPPFITRLGPAHLRLPGAHTDAAYTAVAVVTNRFRDYSSLTASRGSRPLFANRGKQNTLPQKSKVYIAGVRY